MDLPLRAIVVAGDTLVGTATGVLLHPSEPVVLALLVKDLRPLGAERLVALAQIAHTTRDTITLTLVADAFDELAAFDVPHGRWAEETITTLLATAPPPDPGAKRSLAQRVLRWRSPVRGPRAPLGRLVACAIDRERGAILAVIVRPRWPWPPRTVRYAVDQLEIRDERGIIVRPGARIDDAV